MKKVLKGAEPTRLESYRVNNPTNTWEQFTGNRPHKKQVQEQLVSDQRGLCAYCEIDLKPGTNGDLTDLRVEHFHPKSDNAGPANWHLDWHNLLACCHGGSQRNVVDAADRFTSPDNSCDVPKENNDWDNILLNPLHLPASPRVFKIQRSNGAIQVDDDNCDAAGVDRVKAQATIDNLRLNATRLRDLRKAELNRINDLLRIEVSNGLTDDDARRRLAMALLRQNSTNDWPRFFTAIRSYLGSAAEDQLRSIGYDG